MDFPKNKLIKIVLEKSRSEKQYEAFNEWYVSDFYEADIDIQNISCACGKEKLQNIYSIKNKYTGQVIDSIGSKCIEYFQNKNMNEAVQINLQIKKLIDTAIRHSNLIKVPFSCPFYSRKLLYYMYENGVFRDKEYSEEDTYEFMNAMFNKRLDFTTNELKKLKVIIKKHIRPWLLEEYKKIKRYR